MPKTPCAELSRWKVNQTGAVTWAPTQDHHSRKETDSPGPMLISAGLGA